VHFGVSHSSVDPLAVCVKKLIRSRDPRTQLNRCDRVVCFWRENRKSSSTHVNTAEWGSLSNTIYVKVFPAVNVADLRAVCFHNNKGWVCISQRGFVIVGFFDESDDDFSPSLSLPAGVSHQKTHTLPQTGPFIRCPINQTCYF
jgi:hypothetical protein